ncbi:MAG: hypothetical protein JEZ00_00240 [Anaerolineaceae bacterium]|nr:hypothetical protein [Anaerolineaceae bacterium]
MAQKSKGFVHLYWSCPHCKAQNIGKQNVCVQCGSPQPENVEFFHLEASQVITDENEIKRASSGPDIYCPYCGSRNTADSQICVQCGGDIAEGKRRQSGQKVGAFQKGKKQTVACSTCSAENAFDRTTCHQCGAGLVSKAAKKDIPKSAEQAPKKKMGTVGIIFLVLFVALFCGFAIWGLSGLLSKEEIEATVQSTQWQYTVNIERYGPTESKDWQANIPADAYVISCEDQLRSEESEFIAGAKEVCGTPYTVDEGNGYAEVVQDCVYQVYEPYCKFETMDWAYDTSYSANGSNMNPSWPAYSLSSDQRVAEEIEQYVITFSSGSSSYEYETTNQSEFSACTPGSNWILTTNAFDAVLSIDPAN